MLCSCSPPLEAQGVLSAPSLSLSHSLLLGCTHPFGPLLFLPSTMLTCWEGKPLRLDLGKRLYQFFSDPWNLPEHLEYSSHQTVYKQTRLHLSHSKSSDSLPEENSSVTRSSALSGFILGWAGSDTYSLHPVHRILQQSMYFHIHAGTIHRSY